MNLAFLRDSAAVAVLDRHAGTPNAETPSAWSERHRIIYGQPFRLIPPLRAIYDCTAPAVVIEKSAQVMVSEALTNLGLWAADTMAGGRGHAMYTFPAKEQAEDFSKGRIDPAIDESPYLSQRTTLRNVGLKKIGKGLLYVRGAQQRRQIISVDADLVIYDEIAEYPAGTVDAVERRLMSSRLGWQRAGSTPRYPADEMGTLIHRSTRQRYMVRCSHCTTWQALDVQTHLDPRTADVVCEHCHGSMLYDRLTAGEWVAEDASKPWIGFRLNALYSPLADLRRMAERFLKVIEGRATATEMQEFYNSDCGVTYLPEGGHISADALDACRRDDYRLPPSMPRPPAGAYTFLGCDVGKFFHVVVLLYDPATAKYWLLYAGAVPQLGDVLTLMGNFGCARGVIDANPDTRDAARFAASFPGRGYMAYYPNWTEGQRDDVVLWDDDAAVVKANRTAVLDELVATVLQQRLVLPANARELGGAVDQSGVGELYRHMAAPIRVVVNDKHGQPVAKYIENGADHFAHATVYALIAAMAPFAETRERMSLTQDVFKLGGTNIDRRY